MGRAEHALLEFLEALETADSVKMDLLFEPQQTIFDCPHGRRESRFPNRFLIVEQAQDLVEIAGIDRF